MKSYVVHLKNKYPNCIVRSSDSSLDVHSLEGDHVIALRKNAHGQWVDAHEELGTLEKFSLAPIPKEARAFKLYANGMIGKSEEHEERKEYARKNAVNCGSYKKILAVGEKAPVVIEEAQEVEEQKPAKKTRGKK